MSVAGVLIGGMFAGLFQFIAFGVDPFQCFVNGAHALIPISFGTLYVILNALLQAGFNGIGIGRTFIHADDRGDRMIWLYD